MNNYLKIYTSSAGSGKTFTLVKEYLNIVLQRPEEYRHILAITFTNKAANEMKSRVIEALISLESGEPSELRSKLEKTVPSKNITDNAGKVLKLILHDYPSFAISTIDSFFQKLLRSLAREIHLPLRAEIKLEEEDAILEVTEKLLHHSGTDKELGGWLQQLIFKKLEDDKGWNIQNEIAWIAKEILKERGATGNVMERSTIHELYGTMNQRKKNFEATMNGFGKKALEKIKQNGYDESNFAHEMKGIYGYLNKISKSTTPKDYLFTPRINSALSSADNWVRKEDRKDTALMGFIESELRPILIQTNQMIVDQYPVYIGDITVLKTLYLFGIVNDLTKIFKVYRQEHNQILISDTAKLLQEIITGDDTPFIFEKTGNRYRYLLIDEFQDTSEVQWKNLLPLIINSLGSGFMTLVVGDAKQSIYRWRGGDMKLLLSGIEKDLHHFKDLIKPEALQFNFRSKKEIVEFNNNIFTNLISLVRNMDNMGDISMLELAYGKNVAQITAEKNNKGGYVEVNCLSDTKTDTEASAEEKKKAKWPHQALVRTLSTIQDLLLRGYRYRDITILVRTNVEGNTIAQHLFKNNITKVISPDSLLINSAPVVRFMINSLRSLIDPADSICRSQMLHYYTSFIVNSNDDPAQIFQQKKKKSGKEHTTPALFEKDTLIDNAFNRLLPEAFTASMASLAKLPVYEVCEQIISIFQLNNQPDAFLQRFQDIVLEFNARQHASIRSFIQYWDENKKVREKSVVIPENENAIRIMTIHASKGLQFPVVIMPFVDWDILPREGSLIWVQSEAKEFSALGRIGVICNSSLLNSVFKHDYEKEKASSIIDGINMLYVALTRAEEELYLYVPADNEKEINNINKLLLRTIDHIGLELDRENKIILGSKTALYQPKKESSVSVPLTSYPVNKWQDKIRVSTRVRLLSDILKEKSTSKTKYGVLVHELLAAIGNISELNMAMDKIKFDGLMSATEQAELKQLVTDLILDPAVKPFFDTTWKVMREQEIIAPGAEISRPDRILIEGKNAIIVDFKTGAANASHQEQLNRYGATLTKMGYQNIRKYLIYLKEKPEVVEVHADTQQRIAS